MSLVSEGWRERAIKLLSNIQDKGVLLFHKEWFQFPEPCLCQEMIENEDVFFLFSKINSTCQGLTHWGQVTHICVSNLTITGSDNDLLPDLRQAIVWTNAEILLIGPLGRNFSEILIGIITFSFKKMHLEVLSAKRLPFCLSLNVLNH